MSEDAKIYYLTGPMTGIPQFNLPLFRAAASDLRDRGHTLVSPAELDSPGVQEIAEQSADGSLDDDGKIGGETWGDMLSRDVKIISDEIDGIIMLPNWYKSRGARLEVFVALLCNKSLHIYDQYAAAHERGFADMDRWTAMSLVGSVIRNEEDGHAGGQ